ncbi:hypothetical protein MKW98_029224 [Papaver atlanticum]|uniref:Folate gamma-glutamyl hydrolase n=1 Tax=Papaver atlanticum TaxID=357466 RepID=A0AAD4T2J3_9MAGN|nr:hypothetical protein MKW98_029224 [Papaver atlanticum]
MASSYVKLIGSAGARVIPLIYNEPEEILYKKLNLVVEGGFKRVLERNDTGDCFPLFTICLGFELLFKVISKDANILENFSAHNHASTLKFSKPINIQGTIFKRFPPELLQKLTMSCCHASLPASSEDAVQVDQHSLNRPCSRDILDNLIYNYIPTYCGKAGRGYERSLYILTTGIEQFELTSYRVIIIFLVMYILCISCNYMNN